MKASDLAYETVSALDANRARSLLTVLGIVIGIAAVIAMTALIGGVKQSLVGELGLNQARLVNIYCWYNRSMELADTDAMQEELSDIYEYVVPMSYGGAEVASDTKSVSGSFQGVTAAFADAAGLKLVQGRFFTEEEAEEAALVVVLDQSGVRTLFGSADEEVVGRPVRISGAEYLVVGVVEPQRLANNSDYVEAYLPFATCNQRINGWDSVDQVFGFAREGQDMDTVAEATKAWLVRRFQIPEDGQEDYVNVYTMQSVIDELDSVMMSFQVLMTAVASISLVVGGIGIMNMMLTNVTERIREIGLRKALGARRRDITRQFLLESVCLTLVGGIIGIAVGYLGAFALSGLAGGMLASGIGTEGGITPVIEMRSVLVATGICVAIGVLFGYYPARRAARLDPVESLRYQ